MDETLISMISITAENEAKVEEEKILDGSRLPVWVSIIIPIYNGEKYLDHCLNSILKQTYTNFEVLLVDDGSSDCSLEICRKYEKLDCRIKVFHKERGGVSSARNLGLEKAIGEFISFVDVDDLLDEHFLEVLIKDAHEYKADIVCCAIKEIESDYCGMETLRTVSKCRLIHDFNDYFNDYFNDHFNDYVDDWYYGRVVWARIIKREIAVREQFSNLKFGEDTEYMLKLFAESPSTYLDDFQGYSYIRWDQSTTKATSAIQPERMEDGVYLCKTVVELCNKHGDPELIQKSYQQYAESVYSLLSAYVKSGSYHNYSKNVFSVRNMLFITKGKYIGKKQSVAFRLFCFSSLLYWVIFRPLLMIKERIS